MSAASIQARIELESVDNGVARFGSGHRAHCVAVLEVTGADSALGTADDATQEAILAGRAQFVNAQLEPFQLLVRSEPARLDDHLERIRERAQRLPPALAMLARDHATFVGGVLRQRTLLERRCYVVVPAARAGASATSSWLRRLLAHVPILRRAHEATGNERQHDLSVGRQLNVRCDEVGRQLGRSGLRTRLFDGRSYGELYHRCWTPELAHIQRFRVDLQAYTAPVVTGTVQLRGPAPAPLSTAQSEASLTDQTSADTLLELGTRTLADLVALAGCEVRTDHLRLDGQYARVLAVTAYPRTIAAGWLEALVDSDLPVELSLHVRPLPSAAVVRALGHQLVQLQASRLLDAREGRLLDPEREIAH